MNCVGVKWPLPECLACTHRPGRVPTVNRKIGLNSTGLWAPEKLATRDFVHSVAVATWELLNHASGRKGDV